jgi:N-acetyl-anhydromuramyl-L-alanine amidase AmpD
MGNLSNLWNEDETPVVKKQQTESKNTASVKTYGKFNPEEVTHLAIHHTGGTNPQSALNWWKNPASGGVGAQFIIDRDGTVIESAPMTDITGHIMPNLSNKKISNKTALGIEVVAPSDKDVTPAQKEAVRKLYQDRILPAYPNIKLENILGHGELAKGYKGSHARHPEEGMSVVNYLKENLGKPKNNIVPVSNTSSMRQLWEEEPEVTQPNKPTVTIEPLQKEEYLTPEGGNLITPQTAYEPRGIPKLIQQGLTGLVSAPVSAVLGAGEPIAGVAQLAGRIMGRQTPEEMINAFQSMRGGLKEASGPMSYLTNRPAELAGELGPITTNMANYFYKGLPLASDLAKATVAGVGTGSLQGLMSPTEANLNNQDYLKQKSQDILTSAAMGGAFPIAIKGAQYLNKATGLNLGAKVANAPSQEQLASEASNFYKQAEQSGIQFDKKKFAEQMKTSEQDLRKLGYVKPAKGETDPYPEITQALRSLQNPATAKNYEELQILRTIINNGAMSNNPKTRMLAKDLRDSFDDYVLNAPKEHISIGTNEGAQAWTNARNSYNKLKKSEVFMDMLEKAEVEGATKYTQAGAENSLAKQLRQLVNNPKRMRTFSPEEQEQIRSAAVGGNIQNLLKFYGKFAPTSPVTAILANLGSLPLSAGALVSKGMASKIRERDVTNLADLMRVGKEGQITPQQIKIGDLLKMYEMEK